MTALADSGADLVLCLEFNADEIIYN